MSKHHNKGYMKMEEKDKNIQAEETVETSKVETPVQNNRQNNYNNRRAIDLKPNPVTSAAPVKKVNGKVVQLNQLINTYICEEISNVRFDEILVIINRGVQLFEKIIVVLFVFGS